MAGVRRWDAAFPSGAWPSGGLEPAARAAAHPDAAQLVHRFMAASAGGGGARDASKGIFRGGVPARAGGPLRRRCVVHARGRRTFIASRKPAAESKRRVSDADVLPDSRWGAGQSSRPLRSPDPCSFERCHERLRLWAIFLLRPPNLRAAPLRRFRGDAGYTDSAPVPHWPVPTARPAGQRAFPMVAAAAVEP